MLVNHLAEADTVIRIDGQVCVQQGALRVRDAQGDGQPAVLIISPQCIVIVDGYEVSGETTVCSKHKYEISCAAIEPTTKLEVSESQDSLSVTLTVHLSEGRHYRVADTAWGNRVQLRLISEPIPAQPPTVERIYEVLRELGFTGTLDEAAILALSATSRTLSREVLRGTAAVPSLAAAFRVLPLEFHNDALRRWRPVNAVKPGTVVAVYEPTVPGADGTDVRGRNIPAPTSPEPLPRLGDGLSLVEGQLTAVREGRFIHSRTLFDVVPALVLNEDIVAKEGFIEFDGDVTITGSILDGSVVRATGLITVHGGIYGATVVGFGGVRSGSSVAKSRIVAGQSTTDLTSWYQYLQLACDTLQQFRVQITEAVQLQLQIRSETGDRKMTMQFVNALQQVKQALNGRLHELKQSLLTLCESGAPDEKVDDRWAAISRLIRGRWQGIQLADTKMDLVEELDAALGRYRVYVESILNHPPADVEVESIVSSVIQATGDIRVSGRGVISSTIECGGAVEVNGFVRGGSVIAKTSAQIKELGSQLGVETSVSVADALGHIDIRLRHPNTVLELGGARHRNDDTEERVVRNGVSSFR